MELDTDSIEESAEETVRKATTMMATYLGSKPDAQNALEFLCLAEGGEVTHYELQSKLTLKIKNKMFVTTVNSLLRQEKQHLVLFTKLAKQNVTEAQ